MADTKITALSALTAADPANDVLPIVDVNDPFMAASGTTKKISINNILGASGTATLASATISGDLTVDTSTLKVDSTNNRVGIVQASPAYPLDVTGIIHSTQDVYALGGRLALYRSSGASYFDWSTSQDLVWRQVTSVGGAGASTLMTLNSTGLGVGEAATVSKLQPRGSTSDSSAYILYGKNSVGNVICFMRNDGRFLVGNGTTDNFLVDQTGNVGVGVTPITSHILSAAGPVGISGTNAGTRTSYISNANACSIYYTDGGGAGYFTDFGNLIIQPRTSAARSVVIATGSTTPVERAVVKSTGQVRFVPLAADPSGAESGDVYYNSTSNKLKCYNGTSWNDLF